MAVLEILAIKTTLCIPPFSNSCPVYLKILLVLQKNLLSNFTQHECKIGSSFPKCTIFSSQTYPTVTRLSLQGENLLAAPVPEDVPLNMPLFCHYV